MTLGVPPTEYVDRMARARDRATADDIDAVLVSPGPDLRYLTGYDAVPLERLTCLVLGARGDVPPSLVVPALEAAAARAAGVDALGLQVVTWEEADDPYSLVADLVGRAGAVAVDDRMWAVKSLGLARAMPGVHQVPGGGVIGPLRQVKSAVEVAALRTAGSAIDEVHASMGEWLRVGRTERQVARDVSQAILDAGHDRVDFVIIAAGPNGASPHHEVGDRVIQEGDLVVVDIGGTTSAGYCSDCTRTYVMGSAAPADGEIYDVLRAAQAAAVEAVAPGVTAGDVDAAARGPITAAGLGDRFIHRTGHGIGLETHEAPYVLAGSTLMLEPGMAFSVEPGIYLPGRMGSRIEDIVVVTDDGVESLNAQPRELVAL